VAVELRFLVIGRRLEDADLDRRGVVDRDVEPAETRQRPGDQCLAIRPVLHAGALERRFGSGRTQLLDDRCTPRRASARDNE